MKTQENKKNEVYSIRGFRDTLASPVLYPVVVVALLLGVTSMFGFVQNPLKLKSMVNVIHQKVATTDVVSATLENKRYSLSKTDTTKYIQSTDTLASTGIKSFEFFSGIDDSNAYAYSEKAPIDKGIERIAFNYDITSENFWTNLDSSELETATEKLERQQKEAGIFGTPLEINLEEQFSDEFKLNDKSIYALGSSNKI